MRWGPERIDGGRWRFRLWAPGTESVALELSPSNFIARPEPTVLVDMVGPEDGWFEAEAAAAPGTRYRFRLPDGMTVPDPASRAQESDVHGWSLIVDLEAYRWRLPDWTGLPWDEAVIYELHVGLLGGFKGVTRELDRIAELGITAVELMPVNAFSGTRGWGYDGVLPYAPLTAYGTPDELKALIDRAHELGLMVLLDAVYNHFGPDGAYLHVYAKDFFDPGRTTPWGPAIAFEHEPVRRYFIDNALMWLEEYRFDGLRLDAVHQIADPIFLTDLSAEIRRRVIDRRVHLILENEHNDAARLEHDFQAQWNDDFHNVIHVVLTGETEGYYRAFADRPIARLARVLGEGFDYQGETPPGGHPRGTPSGHLHPVNFVAFLQNHDQVGNRAFGDRLTKLTPPARLRAATALLLLSPQIPLMFMGDETGSQSPFLFFTDFHDDLADAVRNGRRGEFAAFAAFADPARREAIPDPNALATFEASRPIAGPDGEAWLSLYRTLIALRHADIVPRLTGARSEGAEPIGEAAVFARWRMGDGMRLTILVNLGDTPIAPVGLPDGAPFFRLGMPGDGDSFAAWLEPA